MIKVLLKALDIVELLAKNPERELPLSIIADSMNMDHGTCSNILKTLAYKGYVQQEAPRRGYTLGYTPFRIVGADMENEEIVKVAREDILRLGEKFNEVAILSVIRNDKRVILFQTSPERDLTVRSAQGKSVYEGNTGRVILANYSPVHLEKFIIRVGLPKEDQWPSVAHAANPYGELMNELTRIRTNGYSVQHDQNDIYGFAAPLFRGSHVVGGLGLYLPTSRMTDSDALIRAVTGTAEEINRKLNLTYSLQDSRPV